ncbi:MAG: TonB-dependent receptor plug domain-containing protein [Thermodesulfobacteriota bacterium]
MKKVYMAMAALVVATPTVAMAAAPVAVMEEVVVTATKTEEAVGDVPNAVVFKDALAIEDSPAQSLGELLAGEPGLDWRTRGDYGGASEEIHIRGMGGDATQVFLNGININSPSMGTADLNQLPLHGVERVEVVKGPGSLLYGTGAMAGTVNILTKSPQRDKADLMVKSGLGTQGALELAAEQGMYVADGLGYFLSASRQEGDGFRDNSHLRHNDASIKLVHDRDKLLTANFYGAWVEREFGVPGVRPPVGTMDYYVNGSRMYGSEAASLVNEGGDRNLYSALELASKPYSWLTLTMRGDAVDMENYFYRRNNGPVWPRVAGEGQESWVTNQVLGIEANAEMRLPHGVTLLLGSQYRDYDYFNEVGDLDAYGEAVAGSRAEDQFGVHTQGIYGEAQYRLNQYLKLLAGLRQEEHSMFGHETLPRFGAVVNPLVDTTVKLGHGKHFKAPTMNDLYWPDNGWTRGNPNLMPETGWHSDITLEQNLLQKKLVATASVFRWNIDDKIDWAENPDFPTATPGFNYWTPSNVSSYEATGWELGLVARPFELVRLAVSYTRTNAEEEKTPGFWRQAQYTPRDQARAELGYYLPNGLTATAVLHYVGDRPAYYASATATEPRYSLDSYVTTDLRLSQRFKEHWLGAITLNNLFDAGYDTYLASFRDESLGVTTRQGYPGAGRSVFVSLSYEF